MAGDRCNPFNYRPISLTCINCKIVESVIKDYLVYYFNFNKLFYINQYGFLKNKSCPLQLLKIMNKWENVRDKNGQIDVIYTDFQKAFDKVSHSKLIYKLIKYGVDENLVKWIENYLRN